MDECKFVRKAENGYEYGHIKIHNRGEKNEKREWIVINEAPDYESALAKSGMAEKSQPKIRPHVIPMCWN